MIKVLIVDDHPFVRFGVSMLLGHADGIAVVGECGDGTQVPGVARSVHPDVVVMDIRMPGMSGLDATRALLMGQPWIRVLMLTASITARTLEEAAGAGAAGYVFKGGDPQDLVTAVRTVAAGGTAWPTDPLGVFLPHRDR